MHFSTLLASVGLISSAFAGILPRSYRIPSSNGFPNPDADQLNAINLQAGGKLPGAPLPTSLGDGSTTAFQLIAFNELFETAYFSSLLYNVTHEVEGFKVDGDKRAEAEKILKTVIAQEEHHALGALATLKSAGKFAPSPCKYQFPTTDLKTAILLAATFTDAVLGALQDANVIFSKEGAHEVVRLISSVIGQEGEQNGFYRLYLDQVPSESPFLTTVPAAFAWSALQAFVVPGSCTEDISKIALPIFPGLMVNGGAIGVLEPKDQTLSFSAELKESHDGEDLYITYTVGQQLPYSVKAENVKWDGNSVSLDAKFPFSELVASGFSHAALTTSSNISTPDDVPNYTLAAPGLIQVQNPL
ncbi:hypothetical protein FPOAC2_06977 [Fusarium poae]|uniref:Late sexual development protein n=1 Tax=Fusarium poae TaxID=36050 RepID=A0A1B8AZ07_FUSPO|nr:hypothetical protein FPOAC1_006846 [Fusarium poae]KAG8673532.1 hypothetical protein FPOAC1_006846 [Fusarium poae]OBS25748.1 hypothetical protein FPOA_06283 [Fusarium poae]